MSTQAFTSAGSTIAISAGTPVTIDAIGFGALSYTKISDVTDMGAIGPKVASVTHVPVDQAVTYKFKTIVDNGQVALKGARVTSDAGQSLLLAAVNSNSAYSFRITLQNGSVIYFQGLATSYTTTIGTAGVITMFDSTCEVSGNIVMSNVVIVPAAIPVIATPTTIGSPSSYTTTDSNVLSQQWTLDGVIITGATSTTYTQVFADSSKALRVVDTLVTGSSATSYPVLAGVQNLKLSNTTNLRSMLASGDGYIVGIGDSAMSGYTSGGTGTNAVNARANSYMAKLVAGLNANGFNATKDAAFGTDQTTVVSDAVAFDPRFAVSGATGVLKGVAGSGSVPVLGGGSFFMAASGAGLTYTPGTAFDTVDYSYLQDSTAGTIQVSGDNFTTFTTLNRNAGVNQIVLTTITVPSGSTTLSVRWASGAGGFCAGVLTRNAASNKIKVIDGAMTGAQIVLFGATPNAGASGTAYLPRATLAQFMATGKKGVLFLNGWFNDQSAGGATLSTILSTYTAICNQAVAAGWDIFYVSYPSLDGASVTQTLFDSFDIPIANYLRDTYNAVIFQESKIFTSYSTYNPLGYYGDTYHLNGNGHQKIADTLTTICKLAAAGTIAP